MWTLYCIYYIPDSYRLENHPYVPAKGLHGIRSYVGITNNFERRIRQHRGEIKGGAKYTTGSKRGMWLPLYTVTGFESCAEMPAAQVIRKWEYKLHHMKNRSCRVCSTCNRAAKLHIAMGMEKVSGPAPPNASMQLVPTLHETLPQKAKRLSCQCFMLDPERIASLNCMRARRLSILILRFQKQLAESKKLTKAEQKIHGQELLLYKERGDILRELLSAQKDLSKHIAGNPFDPVASSRSLLQVELGLDSSQKAVDRLQLYGHRRI